MKNMAPVNVKINPIGAAIIIFALLITFFYVFGLPGLFTTTSDRVSMKELLSASVVLARRGGERVRFIRRDDTLQAKVKGETAEGAKEFVSQGDMQSHEEIFYGLQKAFPGMNVVSEEHEKAPVDFNRIPEIDKHLDEVEKIIQSDQLIPTEDITVWIDPLDATQEYTEMKDQDGSDMLHFVTTMVCVAVKGQPTIGVIHKPFVNNDQGETTWAWAGFGISSNLVKAEQVGKGKDDAHRIIVSRSHAGGVKEIAEKSLGKVVVTGAGGAGYKTLEVINGHQDAYIHSTLIKKWDICAGNAILSAIDGKLTTLDGKPIDYSSGEEPKNTEGLLATTYDHNNYLEKLKDVRK